MHDINIIIKTQIKKYVHVCTQLTSKTGRSLLLFAITQDPLDRMTGGREGGREGGRGISLQLLHTYFPYTVELFRVVISIK